MLSTETIQVYTIDGIRFILNCHSDLLIAVLIEKVELFMVTKGIGQPYAVYFMDNRDEIRICRVTDQEYSVYYKNFADLF